MNPAGRWLILMAMRQVSAAGRVPSTRLAEPLALRIRGSQEEPGPREVRPDHPTQRANARNSGSVPADVTLNIKK
jgi:hypothetical protein